MSSNDQSDPFKDQYSYAYGSGDQSVRYTPSLMWEFLSHVIQERHLPIASILEELSDPESFFLVAATGLGKTVSVPLWLLFRHMHYSSLRPALADETKRLAAHSLRVWVVEPKIAICQNLEVEMNNAWTEWHTEHFNTRITPLFGCKTKADHIHVDAPIMFITTGIFAIYARKGILQADRDIVLIDEAHEVLEADESVELGVGICRMNGVNINYMSATVETSDLPKNLGVRIVTARGKRQLIWRHNTRQPMEECIVDLVRKTLVEQDVTSEYFPSEDVGQYAEIIRSLTEKNRAKGMLVIVNSFASERSDARKIERLLREAFDGHQIEIGLLASEVLRDQKRKKAYLDTLTRWKKEKKRYVLIATSVVEMGVTLPDLDFLVTMNSGFGDTAESGLKHEALGTNALIQRIGRIGRERPGIAYITHEVDAPYSLLDDVCLNADNALQPEPIEFPMRNGTLTALAYHTFEQGWSMPMMEEILQNDLLLPSFLRGDRTFLKRLQSERDRLVDLGIATKGPYQLTKEGVLMERWIGRANLKHAMAAQRAYRGKRSLDMFNALLECAFDNVPRERVFKSDQTPTDALNKPIITIINAIGIRIFTTEYATQEISEGLMELFSEHAGHWDGFVKLIFAFTEAIEIFRNVNNRDSAKSMTFEQTVYWRRAVLTFIGLPSG